MWHEHSGAVGWSVALHAAVAAALMVSVDFRRQPQRPHMLAIEAVMVDESVLSRAEEQKVEAERQHQAELERQRQQEEAERQRQADLERQRQQEEVDRQRQADLELQRQQQEAERQRQAELERQRQQEEEAERQRQAELERQRQQEEAERQRQAELERQRQQEEAERQRQAELERRRQAEFEAELQRAAAEEADRLAAVRSGARDRYVALITNRIEQNWIRPASARAGIDCTVRVTQIPNGEVVDARVMSCNGDDAVVRSIEAAVLRASPLPLPDPRSLFERTLNVRFIPGD